jgi:hypothetical protein
MKYSHKLRWYKITLQKKGFHHKIYKAYIKSDILDTSNINSNKIK